MNGGFDEEHPDGMVVARIEIRRTMTDEEGGDIISATGVDESGQPLDMLQSLGLLSFVQAGLISMFPRDEDEDD